MGDSGSGQGDIKNLLARCERLSVAAWNKSLQLSLHRKRNVHNVIVHKIRWQHNGTGEIQRTCKEDIRESYAVDDDGSPTESNIQLTRIENSSDIQGRARAARGWRAGCERQIPRFTSRIGLNRNIRTGSSESNMIETGGRGPTGQGERIGLR